jgi:molybdate transport system substrate-binding protein
MQPPDSPHRHGTKPLRVLAAGAVKAVMLDLAPAYKARSGRRLDFTFDTVGALAERVLSGEAADVTLLSLPALEKLSREGHGGAVVTLGATGVGLGGRGGVAPQSIATPEEFRAVLLGAESIGYADPARGATAGRHFTGVLDRLDLAETLRGKLRMFSFGVDAVEALARGEVDVAVSQATEIITHPKVTFLGVFPPPYDLSTAYGATALSADEGAALLLSMLREPPAKESLRRAGFF